MASSKPTTDYLKRSSNSPVHRSQTLRQTAADTKAALPHLLSQYRSFNAQASTLYNLPPQPSPGTSSAVPSNSDSITIASLDPSKCPGHKLEVPSTDVDERMDATQESTKANDNTTTSGSQHGTRIRVINGDTLDTAASLQQAPTVREIMAVSSSHTSAATATPPPKPVLILNLASEIHAGGGWTKGTMAQEEELCYRTSLSVSLHHHYYPLPALSAIYSPNIILFRTSFSTNHSRSATPALNLPVYAAISIAGLRHPPLSSSGYANAADRQTTKAKIRLVLRVAAREGHSKLVLGALGCGVFRNPPGEVAACFLEVFREVEFKGGWWEDVVFAVLDNAPEGMGGRDGMGNFGVFSRALDGEVV